MMNRSNLLNVQFPQVSKRLLGFTLIEVLLAMSIFSIAGIALLSTADTHMNNLTILEKKTYADWVASDQLVEANLDSTWPPKNNQKGQVELANHTWFWTQKVIKTTDNNMRAVVVEVRFNEDDELALTSLMTYLSNNESR
ncbi:type II secretion system minor pseudopilin GspI [Thalassotalea profundi]|nr:type II secretion system minor pseudopilin GspI [Thalassotalea profundi]